MSAITPASRRSRSSAAKTATRSRPGRQCATAKHLWPVYLDGRRLLRRNGRLADARFLCRPHHHGRLRETTVLFPPRPLGEGETAGLVTARAPAKEKEQYEFFRSWNYVPGEPVEIRCYSSAGAPRVTLNGRELPMEDCTSDLGAYRCEIPFEAGRTARRRGRGGGTCSARQALPWRSASRWWTISAPAATSARWKWRSWTAKAASCRMPATASTLLVEGAAELIAADNGDLYDPTDCQSPVRRAHQGRMLLTIRSLDEPGRRHGDGFRRKPAPAGRHHRSEISAAPPLGRGGAEKEELSARRGELLFVCFERAFGFLPAASHSVSWRTLLPSWMEVESVRVSGVRFSPES